MKWPRDAARLLGAALLLIMMAFPATAQASAGDLIEAGASQNHFYIEPSYDGTSIALFGSVDAEQLKDKPFDVVVTVRGPNKPLTVWKKERRVGLWVNAQSHTFEAVPNYYAVLATKPLQDIASIKTRTLHEIGIDFLQLAPEPAGQSTAPKPPLAFKEALIKLKRTAGLFVEDDQDGIVFFGSRLFRARAFLPPAAGPGLYRAIFYVLQNGNVIGEATAHIRLNKIGIEAKLSSAAVNHPWLYGILSVVLAAAVGAGASLVFRRA